MGFIAPDPGDRGEPDVKAGRTGGSAVRESRRLVSDGLQVLARGALVCPACSLPLFPAPRVHPRAELRCGYCDHASAAIEFLRSESFDTAANDVRLIARLA